MFFINVHIPEIKKTLEAEFLPDFQNFYTKILKKVSTFQKYILTKYIGWLRGKKMTKNQFFC